MHHNTFVWLRLFDALKTCCYTAETLPYLHLPKVASVRCTLSPLLRRPACPKKTLSIVASAQCTESPLLPYDPRNLRTTCVLHLSDALKIRCYNPVMVVDRSDSLLHLFDALKTRRYKLRLNHQLAIELLHLFDALKTCCYSYCVSSSNNLSGCICPMH